MQRAKSIFAQWRISNLIAWGWDSTRFCCLFAFSLSLFINKSGWVQIRERNWVKQCSYRLFLLCAKFAQHAFCPIYILGRKKWVILWGCSGVFQLRRRVKAKLPNQQTHCQQKTASSHFSSDNFKRFSYTIILFSLFLDMPIKGNRDLALSPLKSYIRVQI